jgi:hypothetical protein
MPWVATKLLRSDEGRGRGLLAVMPGPDDALPMPPDLAEAAEQEGRGAWLTTVPASVRALARRWSLSVGEPFQPRGSTAWVAPARDTLGTEQNMQPVGCLSSRGSFRAVMFGSAGGRAMIWCERSVRAR